MKNTFIKSVSFFAMCMVCFFSSYSQWSTDANIDDTLYATVYNPLTFCTDGHGGAFFTWSQTFTGQTQDILVNRIDSLGHLRFGDSGMLIRRNTKGFVAAPNICEDGHGGCYIAFGDADLPGQPIICHHIDAHGNKLWSNAGKHATSKLKSQYYQTGIVLVNDNGNGVMLAFITSIAGSDTCNSCTVGPSGLYAQRLGFDGTKRWGANGKVIEAGSDIRSPEIIKDGYGGMAIIWPDYSYEGQGFGYTLRMNRLNHEGQLRFTSGSRKLNTIKKIGFGPSYRIILTKNKNYIAVWNSDGIGTQQLYAQKIDSSGNLLWGSTEITFRDTTGEVRYPNLVTDGNDGAYVIWIDGRKINISYGLYAQHLDDFGMKKYASQGKAIDTAASANFPQILTDTAKGFKVFWIPNIDNRMHTQEIKIGGTLRLPGNGPALSRAGNVPFYFKSVLPVADNHEILFLKAGGGKCFAKYAPLSSILPLTLLNFNGKIIEAKNSASLQQIAAIHIFPNPASRNCTIYFDAAGSNNAVLKIFDMNGRLQKQLVLPSKLSQVSVDVSSFAAGTYFCKVASGINMYSEKFIVVK